MKDKTIPRIETADIPVGWTEATLGEVAEPVSHTHRFSGKDNIIFINTGDILAGNFLHRNYSDVNTLPGQAKKMISRNDILFSEIRPINKRYAFVNFDDTADYVVSTKLMVIRAKECILPEYLYRILIANEALLEFQHIAESRSGTFPQITFDAIRDYLVFLPSFNEQRAIAKILSDLDEKIELNQQMNKTLEAIGQALFKRWFVDFEFPDKNGNPHKSSGGKMVDSKLGEIPEEWEVGRFGELAKIQPGFAFKSSDFTTDGYKIIKIKNIQNGIVDATQTDYVSNTVYQSIDRKFRLVSGDVIIAMTGAEIGKIGVIPKNGEIMLLNQRVGKLVSIYFLWAYFMLNGAQIQSSIQGISSASSAQPNISNSDIESTETIIPDITILNQFSRVGNGLYEELIGNLSENRSLSQIRDSLLPKLMSGKIRVS